MKDKEISRIIKIKSYAKINLSLEVGKVMENRMHPVDTVMQAVDLYDVVTVEVGVADDAATDSVETSETATEPTALAEATASVAEHDAAEAAAATDSAAEPTAPTDSVATDVAYATACSAATHSAATDAAYAAAPTVKLTVYGADLATDSNNLAYRAAQLMMNRYGNLVPEELKKIRITLEKYIPLAAGLAGGSGNAAAVLHGLNALWNLELEMEELLALGAALGADVPFCVAVQGKANLNLHESITRDPMAATCARGKGTGADLEPLTALSGAVIIIKPSFSLSTKEVYEGFDKCVVEKRPDNDRMAEAIYKGLRDTVKDEMINLLELYSLKAAPEIASLKALMEETLGAEKVLMSGSGPSVYALFPSLREAEEALAAASTTGIFSNSASGYFITTASLL